MCPVGPPSGFLLFDRRAHRISREEGAYVMAVPFPEIPRVTVDEVKRHLDAGDPVVIVDVRSPEAFAAAHIPGARSMPLRAILDRTHGLPHDREIFLY
jgi:3-mercaptopyruvate sulfurtransferase SseA